MTKPRAYAVRRMTPAVEARMRARFDARIDEDDAVITRDSLLAALDGCVGGIVSVADVMDADFIRELSPSVKVIATHSVGFDHIDLEAAKARGLIIANTPGALTEATADTALLCMLGAARRATEARRMLDEGWPGWRPTQLIGLELNGARCGVLGMGRIGRAFARRAKACGMEIHYYNRSRLDPELEDGATYHETPESLFRVSQVLSLHAPASESTRGIINEKTIALLPEGVVLVNSARGDLVDEDALIAALKSGRIAAAGLDVFANEPNVDPRFLELPNVYPLPHMGSATLTTRTAMGMMAVAALEAVADGREPEHRVV